VFLTHKNLFKDPKALIPIVGKKLIYKEQTNVYELRKRTKNKEQKTKNKDFTVERTRSRKMSQLVTVIPSVLFIEGNKHYRKIKH
jgi:hypothetical protein